jgi:hypothetical protein
MLVEMIENERTFTTAQMLFHRLPGQEPPCPAHPTDEAALRKTLECEGER